MKKFHFTLTKMLDYKDQILEKEKNTLMQCHFRKNQIVSRIEMLEREFERINRELQEEQEHGSTICALRMRSFQLENIRRQCTQLKRDKKVAEAAIEKQLKVVVSASQEVSSLDKLKEKQLEEYKYQERKADEEVIAEFVSMKYIRDRQTS